MSVDMQQLSDVQHDGIQRVICRSCTTQWELDLSAPPELHSVPNACPNCRTVDVKENGQRVPWYIDVGPLRNRTCHVDAKTDVIGSSSTGESPPSEQKSSSLEQLLVEMRETTMLLRELVSQNAMVISLVLEEREENEQGGGSQYLDGQG